MSKPAQQAASRPEQQSALVASYYTAHRSELLAYVSSRLGGGNEAEDIVQNVFLRLLTCDKMLSAVTLPALVFTTARNLVTDYYRRRSTREEYEHYLCCSDRRASSAESLLSIREITERLERGLARVPEKCREVYRMHVYGGMKVGEISRQTGEGYKSVEFRIGAARKAVRLYLRNYYPGKTA